MNNLTQDPNWNTLQSMLHQEQSLRTNPNNFNLGSPLEGGSPTSLEPSEEYTTRKTPEQKLKDSLTEAIKNYSVFISSINTKNKDWGTSDIYSADLYLNWLNNKQLDRILDPDNDSYTFCDFVNILVKSIKSNQRLANKSVFVKSKLTYKPINIKEYISDKLALDKDNEIHKLFLDLVTKFVTYYNNQEAEQRQQYLDNRSKQIHTLFSEAELYLKQELLDEDPTITKINFTDNTIDELIDCRAYHTDNVDNKYDILKFVQLVIYNGDTLQNIPGLTADSDWYHIIYNWYDLDTIDEPSEEEQFNDLDENELPTFDTDLFDYEKNAEEYRQDAIRREKLAGATKAGKLFKQNHKVEITIRNIETNETHTFESSDDCAKFLGISKRTMVNFKQGNTKLNKIYQIIG